MINRAIKYTLKTAWAAKITNLKKFQKGQNNTKAQYPVHTLDFYMHIFVLFRHVPASVDSY